MSRWLANIGIGLKGLLLFKIRTFLSTLGVMFGVAAVISMMSIGEGAKRVTLEFIKLLGTNNIRISHFPLTGKKGEKAELLGSKGLTYDDAILIEKTFPELVKVAPVKLVGAKVRYEGRQGTAKVLGVDPEWGNVLNFRLVNGRFINRFDILDTKNVCVLGYGVKQELFGYRDPIGSGIRIGDEWFTVIGVMEPKFISKSDAAKIKVGTLNSEVYIPITTALRRFPGKSDPRRVEVIAVRASKVEDITPLARLIHDLLKPVHKGVVDYQVKISAALLAQAQHTHRTFNIIMGSIAGISLLVGGIGIMNVMLANVSERTREIGIRRAIGATERDILIQFLVETVLICLVGGSLGIVLGFGIAEIITLFAGWPTGFSVVSVVIAFVTSVSVGLLFGLSPARRAAQLNPVQALRFE